MEKVLAENQEYLRNGTKEFQIKDNSGTWSYRRQQLVHHQENGKKSVKNPIDSFFGDRTRGVGHVSRTLEKKALTSVLENSYRKSEKINEQKLKKETIRRRLLEKGEQAKKLEKTKKTLKVLEEKETKDASGTEDTYKQSKGSRIRAIFGKIFGWTRLYLMVDGVGVQAQDRTGKTKGEWAGGSKECKVASILKQKGDQIEEVGTFGTWERITGFRKLVEMTMLSAIGIVGLFTELIIISDGAKWIRNLRENIVFLKRAIWILDWFHVKDRIEKLLRALEIDTESKRANTIRKLLWFGSVDEAIKRIEKLPIAKGKEKREMQKAAKNGCINYLENQREGIVNYQLYQMKGYFVGSGFIEKKNDTLIKNRMVRQKRMRWSQVGGEAMMQVLTAQMNGRFNELFA